MGKREGEKELGWLRHVVIWITRTLASSRHARHFKTVKTHKFFLVITQRSHKIVTDTLALAPMVPHIRRAKLPPSLSR
jgi:hypothetical protein